MIRRWAQLALAALLVSGCALGGVLPGQSRPFLYRIDGEAPSYLFGTIHVPDERVRDLAPPVRRALAGSSLLYTEVALEPGARTKMTTQARQGRKKLPPLRERLPDDLYQRLEAYLALQGLPVRAFDQRSVWAVAVALPLLDYLQAVQTQPVLDEFLVELAAQWGVHRDSLETVQEQVAVFEQITPGAQVRLLDATVTQLERDMEEGRSGIEELVQAYLSGSERRLLRELAGGDPDDPENREIMARILDGRSRTMADRIAALLAEDPARTRFFAVGAGHLPGAHGIVSLLRASGHDVRRVDR